MAAPPMPIGLRIGTLALESPIILAPMCGVCDFPYIRLMRRYDAASLAFHEMFSAVGLMHWHRRKDAPDLTIPEELKPLGLQLFGHEPEVMAAAAQKLAEFGAAVVDLNLGCPVPKVTSGCDGSALLKEPALLGRILEAMVKALPDTPVTIKMRLGYSDEHQNYLEIARIAEEAGVAAITVHGRTRSQMYSGRADWDKIAEVAAAVSVPVIGNGDVADPGEAIARMRDYGVAGVMIGRAAMGNPWVIPRMAHFARTGELLPEPDHAEKLRVALDHAELMIAEKGERQGLSESRRHITWYTRGMPGSAELRELINQTRTRQELQDVVSRFIERLARVAA